MTQGIENIEIHNPIGGSYGIFPVTDKCERSVTLMGDDYVKLAFSLTKQRFQFEAFSYIVYDGKHYFLPERYRPTPQGSNYDYAMTFVSAANMLSKSLFMRYYQVPTEEDPTVFRDIQPEPDINVNADLIDIITILLRSIQGASDRVPVFSNTKTIYAKMIAGMTLDTDDMIDGTELKTFAFESNNIEEVLNNIAEQYKTEWWITESAGTPVNLLKLHICKCEQRTQSDGGGSVLATPTVLSDVFIYKDGEAIPYSSKGLLSVGYAQEWSNIPQRIIPFGSDRNIIRTQALDKLDDKDVYVSYGKRLRLNPNHQVTWQGVQRNGYIVKQKDGTDDFLPVGSFGEVNNPNVTSGIEKTELFDDIYPQGHFLVTKCELSESGTYFIIEGKAIKQNADGTPMKEDGEYVTYTWREMCTPLGEDVFTPGDKKGLGLVPLQNKNQTEDLTIHFESGWLNGREFGVSRNNGVKETEDGVEVQVLSLDIVPDGNEDEALALPNANFYPQVGDMFAIFNMDMPQGYIDMAEQRLAQATYEKLIEYQNSRPDVKCKSEPTFFSKLSAMLVGKRFAVFSELFGDIVYIDDDPDKGIDEEHSAVFTSRVTAYSHSLTNPASIDFTLASGMVAGRLASLEAMISDTSSELRGLEQRHINLSKRGWHDAEELSQMLESLTTEMMLVGNAKYQFGYTFGIVLDNDNMVISNVKHTKSITVQGGGCLQHTQKPYIDYPNQGLWYVDETEINLYQSNGTPIYDPTKPYYLYAIVNNTGARLTNQDIVLAETEQNGDMYMLLGVLSSEFEDEVSGQKTSYRIFSRTNGYTAIVGGTITTEQIQDANRQLIIDFQHMPPRIIARGGAEIIGNITFKSFKDESGNNPLISLGRNLLRDTAFKKKGADFVGWTFYDGSSAGKTQGGCSFKTNADDNTIESGAVAIDIKANHRVMLTQTAAHGYNTKDEVYTFSAKVKSSVANTDIYFGAGYSNFPENYGKATIGTSYTTITLQAKVPTMPNGVTNYAMFFMRLLADTAAVITVKEAKLEKGTFATSWIVAPEDTAADIVENKNYIDAVEEDLQKQIDGVIDSYFMKGVPTMSNRPVTDWRAEEGWTEADFARHEGDTYTNIQSYTGLDITQWEQGRVYYGTEYIGKTLDECKSISSASVHAQGVRCKNLIPYESGDTLLINTNGGEYDILVTYFGAKSNSDSTIVQKTSTYYTASSYTTVQEIALNTNYALCNVSIRKTSAITPEITRNLGLCINPTAGHSWRFCNNDDENHNTWHWHEIADSDAVKALQDAAAAQDTADGKRRVFTVQPVPPYDAGDLWANATYSGGGITYDNVLLKCKTSKAKGQSFAIADWEDSSRAIASADAAKAAADDAMQKALDIADDGIISGGTEKATIKKEWQEIAGDNMLGTVNGSYKKALDQAAAYGITVDTNSAIKTAYRALDDAMWIVIGYNGDTDAWTDEYMHVDTYLKNDDGTEPTVPTGANYLAKKRSEFSALWRAYYDAEIALLNTVSDTIDQKEIGGENLYTKADPLTVNVGATVRTGVHLTANKTYVISIGSKTGTGKITIFGVTGSTYTPLGEIPSAAFSKQWYTILKPTSNGELGFYEQSNTGAENHTLSLIMLQEGEKPTTYQNTYKFLAEAFEHDATKLTTSIDGGLIIAALLKLMNAQGNITAGISGLDDGLVLWGGGTYAQALSDVLGTTDILPVLLTTDPYGIGSKIGIFKIKKDASYNHYIQVDNDGVPSIQMFKDRTAASVISELSPTTTFPAGSTQYTDKVKVVGKYYKSQSRWEYDHWVNNNYIETTSSWSRSASDSKTLLSRQMTLESSIYKFQSNVSFHPSLYASQIQLPNAGTYNGSASSSVTIRLTVTNVVTNEVVAQDSFSATPGTSQSFNKDFAITKSFTVPSKGTYNIQLTAALDASCAAPGSYNTPASDVEVYGEAQGKVTYNGGSLTNLSSRTVLCKDGFVYLCGGYNFTLRQDANSLDVRMVGLPNSKPSDSGRLYKQTVPINGTNHNILCIS